MLWHAYNSLECQQLIRPHNELPSASSSFSLSLALHCHLSLLARHAPRSALWLHCNTRQRLWRHLWPALAQVFISFRVPLPSFSFFLVFLSGFFFLFYFVILMPANNLIKRFVFSFLWWFFALLSHFICAHRAHTLSHTQPYPRTPTHMQRI